MKPNANAILDRWFCRYLLIDLCTGRELVRGAKWKDKYILHMFFKYEGMFKTGWRRRKIGEYIREITVKGRPCLLVVFEGAPVCEVYSIVTSAGCLVGLKGTWYDYDGDAYLCKKLLASCGYFK